MSPNSSDISRTVFTHISHFHGLFVDWIRVRDKGTKICDNIAKLKLEECTDDYYPHELKQLTEGLIGAMDSFKTILDSVNIINKQLKALTLLQYDEQPIITTWSANLISNTVDNVYSSMVQDFKLKSVVTENIAHCRIGKLIEVYLSSWELDTYLDVDATAYLFAELALPPVTTDDEIDAESY